MLKSNCKRLIGLKTALLIPRAKLSSHIPSCLNSPDT